MTGNVRLDPALAILIECGASALFSYKDNSVNGNTTTDGAFTAVIATQ